ncbi:type II secretion system protein [candidate division KSB1 bacterium]
MNFIKTNKGFTLIELVMVIVILGILAAVAVPKFQDMSNKAHAAAVQGIVGGVQGGITIYQAQALVGNTTSLLGSQNSSGYPTGLEAASTGSVSLFSYVLSPEINDPDWVKGTSSVSGDPAGTPTNDYVYLTDLVNGGTCTYFAGTGVFKVTTAGTAW